MDERKTHMNPGEKCGHDERDHDRRDDPAWCLNCSCNGFKPKEVDAATTCRVPYVDVCHETAYGTTTRLPFMVRVF